MSIKEESHTLREWQKILANNPELMAEFEELTPPTPIKGDISEQPVIDHHDIEVEFRGEKVTISREFYRDGEMNYSTSEQDDNAIWAALRAWCEEKGITPFELYPKKSEQPVEGLEENDFVEEVRQYYSNNCTWDALKQPMLSIITRCARHFAEWGAEHSQEEMKLPDGLEEAAKEYATKWHKRPDGSEWKSIFPKGAIRDFIAGAEWQKEQMMDEWLKDRDGCFWDGVEEGKKAMEKQMLEESVEGEVVKDINNKLGAVTAKNVNLDKFKFGDKVRVIVIKEDEK